MARLGLVSAVATAAVAGAIAPASAQGVEIRVQEGETLEEIAKRVGLPALALRKLNRLSASATLQAGDRLRVPGSALGSLPASAPREAGAAVGAMGLGHSAPPSLVDGVKLPLTYSVGTGGENHAAEVAMVSFRLVGLGYLERPRSQVDRTLRDRLALFDSITRGSRTVRRARVVKPGSDLHRWLEAGNAPRWERMPENGIGFDNHDIKRQPGDHHEYGTHWTADVIRGAGQAYERSYRSANPRASLIQVNDVSLRWGGDTRQHKGHETGLDIDVRLPTTRGGAGTTVGSRNYDRAATRAMLRAFRAQPGVSRILLNDPKLIAEGLCSSAAGHHNHFHVDVSPPGLQTGAVVSRWPTRQGGVTQEALGKSSLWNADSFGNGAGQTNAPAARRFTRGQGGTGGSTSGATRTSGATPAVPSGLAESANFAEELRQPPMRVSQSDLEVLARICKGEALQCDFEGKVAVLATLLNRVRSAHWPNTISGVAHQPRQFSCYNPNLRDRFYYGPIPAECWEAARAAVEGRDPSGGADHYYNPYIVNPGWQRQMRFLRRIGTKQTDTHVFYQAYTDHQRDAQPAGAWASGGVGARPR
jgi:spore germination cell wall hydrolase CwlJ-like protein/LysM repeat protein